MEIQFVGDLDQCTNKNINLNVDELVDIFKSMSVTMDKHTLEEFVQIDDEHNQGFLRFRSGVYKSFLDVHFAL